MYQNLKGHNVLYMIFIMVMNILCLAVFMRAMEFSLQVSIQKSFSLWDGHFFRCQLYIEDANVC